MKTPYHGPVIAKEHLTKKQQELHAAASEALHMLGFALDKDLDDAIEVYLTARMAFRASMGKPTNDIEAALRKRLLKAMSRADASSKDGS